MEPQPRIPSEGAGGVVRVEFPPRIPSEGLGAWPGVEPCLESHSDERGSSFDAGFDYSSVSPCDESEKLDSGWVAARGPTHSSLRMLGVF